MAFEKDLNLEATELRLGLPGTSPDDQSSPINRIISNKRALPSDDQNPPESGRDNNSDLTKSAQENPPPTKAQVVGWPPVRSFRKNCFQAKKKDEATAAAAAMAAGGMFIKVSMDGAPFLRKVDLKTYQGYPELLQALENMFKFSLGNFLKHGSRHHNRSRMKIYSTFVVFLQVSFAREKGITGRNLFQLMKIKMAIGCSSVTFPGSKFQSLPKITSMQLFFS
ncbi:auxin-induced protein 22D-like [Cucurbita pepo subsp. pepo]|uniref:auxin-induced protein 22D-like n=1 Tax=Cucurbita pepo subsp. pepo TaxID=3664 RepID=UPI000C9D3308|nr:auxin-induced protein 22D-like [Cucurbita pepo subsp. pepo]